MSVTVSQIIDISTVCSTACSHWAQKYIPCPLGRIHIWARFPSQKASNAGKCFMSNVFEIIRGLISKTIYFLSCPLLDQYWIFFTSPYTKKRWNVRNVLGFEIYFTPRPAWENSAVVTKEIDSHLHRFFGWGLHKVFDERTESSHSQTLECIENHCWSHKWCMKSLFIDMSLAFEYATANRYRDGIDPMLSFF